MRNPFRLTTALYPAMGVLLALSALLSRRQPEGHERMLDYVFPLIHYLHPAGSGTFFPGSFAFNFFVPALLVMVVLNVVVPARFGPLLSRAKLFYYILALVIAIVEVGADTVLPLIALPGRWRFPIAVSIVHATFVGALAVARLASRGAEGEW